MHVKRAYVLLVPIPLSPSVTVNVQDGGGGSLRAAKIRCYGRLRKYS